MSALATLASELDRVVAEGEPDLVVIRDVAILLVPLSDESVAATFNMAHGLTSTYTYVRTECGWRSK